MAQYPDNKALAGHPLLSECREELSRFPINLPVAYENSKNLGCIDSFRKLRRFKSAIESILSGGLAPETEAKPKKAAEYPVLPKTDVVFGVKMSYRPGLRRT